MATDRIERARDLAEDRLAVAVAMLDSARLARAMERLGPSERGRLLRAIEAAAGTEYLGAPYACNRCEGIFYERDLHGLNACPACKGTVDRIEMSEARQ